MREEPIITDLQNNSCPTHFFCKNILTNSTYFWRLSHLTILFRSKMTLAVFVSSLPSTSSLSQFDLKHDGISQEYYYDNILREYIIQSEVVPIHHPWDLSLIKPHPNQGHRFGTPATSIINRHSFESSPLHVPLDAFLLDDPLDFPSNTLDPATSLFDQDSLYYTEDYDGSFGSERLSTAWEGYQLLLGELRAQQEQRYQFRSLYADLSGGTLFDIPGVQLMEWLVSHFQNSAISFFPEPDIEGFLDFSFGSSPLINPFNSKEEVILTSRKRRFRERVHDVSIRFVVWVKSICSGQR